MILLSKLANSKLVGKHLTGRLTAADAFALRCLCVTYQQKMSLLAQTAGVLVPGPDDLGLFALCPELITASSNGSNGSNGSNESTALRESNGPKPSVEQAPSRPEPAQLSPYEV